MLSPVRRVASWWNDVTDRARKVEWLYAEAVSIMPADGASDGPSAEFEMADMMQAVVKSADVLTVVGELPVVFWLALVGLIWAIVHVAIKLIDLWVLWVLSYFGRVAYAVLCLLVVSGWPANIFYFARGSRFAAAVLEKHQRTVQLFGLPSTHCQHEAMAAFCKKRKLEVTHISIAPAAVAIKGATSADSRMIELLFSSPKHLEDAFAQKQLQPLESFAEGGATVRARRKAGTYTASVDYWVLILTYFSKSIPKDYWLHTILSSLVTLSLGDDVLDWLWEHLVSLFSFFGVYAKVPSMCGAGMTLASVCLFAGYQAFENVKHAYALGLLRRTKTS